MTPEIRQLIDKLKMQIRNKKILGYSGAALGTGVLGATGYKIGENIFGI